MNKWALLDEEGNPIRFYSYPAKNAVDISEPEQEYKIDWNNFEEAPF